MDDKDIKQIIKEQAEQIPVPETLKPGQVEERLVGKTPKRVFLRLPVRVLAACLALFVCGSVWYFLRTPDNKTKTVKPVESTGTTGQPVQKGQVSAEEETGGTSYAFLCETINSCNDVEKDMANSLDIASAERSETQKSTESEESTGMASSEDFSDTDEQVQGISEGDIVKTDGSHIYTVRDSVTGSKVCIYDTSPKQIADFRLKNVDVNEMYLYGDKLVILAQRWPDSSDVNAGSSAKGAHTDVMFLPDNMETEIWIYDISDPATPKKIVKHTQSGSYNTSRMADGFLYVFSDYYVSGKKHDKEKPETFIPLADGEVLQEKDIETVSKKKNNRYMVMTSLALQKPEKYADRFSAFGGSDKYYMNEAHIFITERLYDAELDGVRTRITRFGYQDGSFEKQKSVKIQGFVQDSYNMHEYNGYFIVVYTRYGEDMTDNGLCVMNEKMEVVGELTGLGKDEEIYSSYYLDNMAYFVTYRNTDPVFAVDLSNPKKPELVSKLKLPGFSDYLHSFGDSMLLGVGQGERKGKNGIDYGALKLSVFEYDNGHRLKEKDTWLAEKFSSSIAGLNHKAVFVDEERSLVGLGVENGNNGESRYQVFSYKNGKWKSMMKQNYVSSSFQVRGLRIGERFYVVDVKKGITVYDLNSWKKLAS